MSSSTTTTTITTTTSSSTIKPAIWMPPPSKEIRNKALDAFTTTLSPASCLPTAECTICLEALCSADTQDPSANHPRIIRPNICGHTAHHACLLTWTERNSSCPYCRQEMFVAPGVDRAYKTNSLRKFAIPFESGEYVISERLYAEWENSCESEQEFGRVMEFREFWDERAIEEYVEGLRGFVL